MTSSLVRPAPPLAAARRRKITTITTTAGLILLAVEAVLARHYLGTALRALTGARPFWVLAAAAATAVSMQCFARTQRRMLNAADAGKRMPMLRMVGLVYSANALNMTLPAGSALSVAYVVNRLRQWGSTSTAAAFTVVASGVLSSTTFLALAAACALAAGTAATTSVAAGSAVGAGVAVAAVLVARRRKRRDAALHLRRMLAHVERRLRRRSARGADVLRDAISGLGRVHLHRRDWLVGTGLAAANWLADFACLIACCHAVGVSVTAPVVLLGAYLAGMSASSVAFLPCGFGVIEVAMIAALHAGGVLATSATTAVLLYRLISCLSVVAIGWIIWACSAFGAAHERVR